MIKKGTLSKKGKPTMVAVNLFLTYFKLGGNYVEKKINPKIWKSMQESEGFEKNEGLMPLIWGLVPMKEKSQNYEYSLKMIRAKKIAWDIFTDVY